MGLVARARSNVEAEVFTSQCGASTSSPLAVNGQRTFVIGLQKQVSRLRSVPQACTTECARASARCVPVAHT